MGFQFDWMMEPSWSTEGLPTHELFSKGAPFEDVGAFAYYATWGAADPKAPLVEIPATMRMTGLGFVASYFRQLPFAMVVSGLLGWYVDPADKREGGHPIDIDPSRAPTGYWARGSVDPWSTW